MNLLTTIKSLATSLQVPAWSVLAAAGLAAIFAVALIVWATRETYRKALRWVERVASAENTAARQRVQAVLSSHWTIIVGVVAMSVSTFNLYHWARGHAQLPAPMAAGFVAGLDGATVGLVLEMYRRSNVDEPQEAALRIIRRMAWTLVAISATANWAEASGKGLLAQAAMASSPITAALLIELNLAAQRAEVRAAAGLDTQDDGVAGPVRLIVVLWRKLWTAVFTWLGLDARATGSEVERDLLAQRAAEAMNALRLFEEAEEKLAEAAQDARTVRRVQKKRKRLVTKATRALKRAHVTTDAAQGLAYARVMYTLTQAPAMALVDYADPQAVMTSIEDMRIELSAERIEAGVRAQAAEAAREKAEALAAQAVRTQEAAEAATRAAVAAAKQAAEDEAKSAAAAQAAADEATATSAVVAALKAEADEIKAETAAAISARDTAALARTDAESARQEAAEVAEALTVRSEAARQEAEAAQRTAQSEAEAAALAVQRAEVAQREIAAERQKLADEMVVLGTARAEAEAARVAALTTQRRTAEQLAEAEAELARLEDAQRQARAARRSAEEAAASSARRKEELDADSASTAAAREAAAADLAKTLAARQEAESAQARALVAAKTAGEHVAGLTAELQRLDESRREQAAAVQQAEARLEKLRIQVAAAAADTAEAKARGERAVALSRAALGLLERLQGDAAAARPSKAFRLPEMGSDGPLWQSEGKQAGWELYLSSMLATGTEPERDVLVAVGGVQDGRVRGWLGEFRRVLLEMVIGASVQDSSDAVQDLTEHEGAAAALRAEEPAVRAAGDAEPDQDSERRAELSPSRAAADADRAEAEGDSVPSGPVRAGERVRRAAGESGTSTPSYITPEEELPEWLKGRGVGSVTIGTPRSSEPVGARS